MQTRTSIVESAKRLLPRLSHVTPGVAQDLTHVAGGVAAAGPPRGVELEQQRRPVGAHHVATSPQAGDLHPLDADLDQGDVRQVEASGEVVERHDLAAGLVGLIIERAPGDVPGAGADAVHGTRRLEPGSERR